MDLSLWGQGRFEKAKGWREFQPPASSLDGRSGRVPALPYPPAKRVSDSGVGIGGQEKSGGLRQRHGHVNQFAPAGLESGNGIKRVEVNGPVSVEAGVGSEEVVVRDEENGEDKGAVAGIEARSGAGVEAIGAIESFDELFEGAVLRGRFVEVFQAEDLGEGEGVRQVFFLAFGVDEVNAGGVGAQAIEDEMGFASRCGASDFVHGDNGVLGVAFGGDMIAGDLVGLRPHEEKRVGLLPVDFDENFVAGTEGIGRPFVREIELVQVTGGSLAVVEDGLVGQRNLEDLAQNACSHPRAEPVRDVEGENEADDVVGTVDAGEIDTGRTGGRQLQVFGAKVIFAVNVANGEL